MKLSALLIGLFFLASASDARAQIDRGDVRLSLDTDMISIASVSIKEEDAATDEDYMVFGIGPSQLGSSRATLPTAPLAVGLGWALTNKVVLGLRVGFGADIISPDDAEDNTTVLAFSLAPGLTFLPIGRTTKLFIALSPLLQVERVSVADEREQLLRGGFSTGLGALIGTGNASTVDLGFFFEGRFGKFEFEDEVTEVEVRDLRGVVRLGISLWR